MKYKVIWRHHLIPILAQIYLDARQRGVDTNSITAAAAEIDVTLEKNPNDRGESRANLERILVVTPLVVEFEVYEDESVVLVNAVRFHMPHPH